MENTNTIPDVSKEDKEKILNEKMASIRKKNEELRKRHEEIEADKKLADKYSASVQMEDVKPYVMKPHRPRPEKMYSASEQNFDNEDITSGVPQDVPLLSRQRLPQNDGPPPDPSYRFLADPDRDGSEKKEDEASKGEYGRRGGRGRDRREGGSEDYRREGASEDYRREGASEDYRKEGGSEDYRREGGSEDYRREGGSEDYRREGAYEDYRRGRGNSEYAHRGRGGGGFNDNGRGGYDDGGSRRGGGFEVRNRGRGRFDGRGRSRGGEDRGRGRGGNWRGSGRGQERRYDNNENTYENQQDGFEKGHRRGRGQRRPHSGRGQQRAYEQWKAERAVIDEARISRARSGDGEWKREWDMEKIEQENKNIEEPVEYDPRYPRSKGEGYKLKDMITENAMKKLEELSLDDEAYVSNSQQRGGRRGNRRSRGGGIREGRDRQHSETNQSSRRSHDNWREPNQNNKGKEEFANDFSSEERTQLSDFENGKQKFSDSRMSDFKETNKSFEQISQQYQHSVNGHNERQAMISSSCEETLREGTNTLDHVQLNEILLDLNNTSFSHNIDECLIDKDSYLTLEATIAENNAPALQDFSPVNSFEVESCINISDASLSDTFNIEDKDLKIEYDPCLNVERQEIEAFDSDLPSPTARPNFETKELNFSSLNNKTSSISGKVEKENLHIEVVNLQYYNQEISGNSNLIVAEKIQENDFKSQNAEVFRLTHNLSPCLAVEDIAGLTIESKAGEIPAADSSLNESIGDNQKILILENSVIPVALNSLEIGNNDVALENTFHSNSLDKKNSELGNCGNTERSSKSVISSNEVIDDNYGEKKTNIPDSLLSIEDTINNDPDSGIVDVESSESDNINKSEPICKSVDKSEKLLNNLQLFLEVDVALNVTESILSNVEQNSLNSKEDNLKTEIPLLDFDNLSITISESKSEIPESLIEEPLKKNVSSKLEGSNSKIMLNPKKKVLPSTAAKGVTLKIMSKPALKSSRTAPTLATAKASPALVSKPVVSKSPLAPKTSISKKIPLKTGNPGATVQTKLVQPKHSQLKNSVDLKSKTHTATSKLMSDSLNKTKSEIKPVSSVNVAQKVAVGTESHDAELKLETYEESKATSVNAIDSQTCDESGMRLKSDLSPELKVQINEPIISATEVHISNLNLISSAAEIQIKDPIISVSEVQITDPNISAASILSNVPSNSNCEIQQDIAATTGVEASEAESVLVKDTEDVVVVKELNLEISNLEAAVDNDLKISAMNTLTKPEEATNSVNNSIHIHEVELPVIKSKPSCNDHAVSSEIATSTTSFEDSLINEDRPVT